MTWMLTAEGRVVDHLDPINTAAGLSVGAIAHSLSLINRFTGHTRRPYSVAEHSLLVCDILERELLTPPASPWALLAGLMHDAHECITGDAASPVKAVLGETWRGFELGWERTFARMFGLREAATTYAAVIKRADLMALATERRDLMPPGGPDWPILQGIEPAALVSLHDHDSLSWQDWRQAFTDRFGELQFACQLRCPTTTAQP